MLLFVHMLRAAVCIRGTFTSRVALLWTRLSVFAASGVRRLESISRGACLANDDRPEASIVLPSRMVRVPAESKRQRYGPDAQKPPVPRTNARRCTANVFRVPKPWLEAARAGQLELSILAQWTGSVLLSSIPGFGQQALLKMNVGQVLC